MARIDLFRGGNVQNQGVTDARFRAADFGENPLATGLKALGRTGAYAADKLDEIEDVRARVEANRLAVEHSEATRQLGQTVQQSLGENSEGVVNSSIEELRKATQDVLGRASPRARLLLENEIRTRNGAATDQWLEHGFRQKADALETSSVARISRVVDDAADVEDEDKAVEMLGEIRHLNEERARFFGKGKDWLMAEDQKYVSGFYKSRALKLSQGGGGSASAAIAYAEKHRDVMTDDDYQSIVGAYNNSALDEAATALVYGANPVGATVTEPQDPEDGGPPARLDATAFFKGFVVPHEGRSYLVDSNGAGVKFGINEQYNPGVNVKGLTEEGAAKIFEQKYFKKSGADKLPPALAAVHADTFFMNERQAGRILKESGGDVDRYIELRRDFLNGLARSNPGKYGKYQRGWEKRTQELADYADRQGGDGSPMAVPLDANTDLTELRNSIMQRTDIGMNLKRRVIQQLEARRAEVRQERAIQEEAVDRQLLEEALQLGDNFTDVKKLPQDLWMQAPGTVRDRYIRMAESNKTAAENKPLTPEVAAQIGFLRSFKPESLADPSVLHQLAKKGVPPGRLSQLAQEGGQARGALAAAKPEAIARGALESVARPAFEAAGYRLWTTEAGEGRKDKDKRAVEQQQDARATLQLLNFLDAQARTWALANPGKHPDEETMRTWVGRALIVNSRTGQPVSTMSDNRLVAEISGGPRQIIERRLRDAGLPATPRNIADYYRRYISQHPEALR